MIHGLSKHSKSGASAAVDYVLSADFFDDATKEWTTRDPAPVIIEGDPELMKNLCNSLDFKNKYTSGVLSFSKEESQHIWANPGMKEAILEDFKAFMFAGIDKDDCKPLLVVEHTHLDRLELHYQTPRVHLESGKYFNPFPPNYSSTRGLGANKTYKAHNDTFTDYMCKKYDLQNPRDPQFARDMKIYRFDPNKVSKEAINQRVNYLVDKGAIKNREDIVSYLEKAGGKITRKGDDYISVKFDENKKAIRLKGPMYGKESFAEIRHRYEGATAGRAAEAEGIDGRYAEVLSRRAEEVSKRHTLKGLAAERAEDFDRKSALELGEYADELKALKDSLPDAADFSRRVSDGIVNDGALVSADTAEGIETGVASSTSDADPILTGNPGSDALIKAFHSMQKKLAAEELQRSQAKWQIDPNQEKMVRELTDAMTKLFGGLAMGKNFVTGRPGAMSPSDIAQARQAIQAQHRELQRELRAVATVVKQKERTEPLQDIMNKPKAGFEAKAEQPAPLSPQVAKLVDQNAVVKPAKDIDKIGGIKTLRSNWLHDKVHAVRSEADFWNMKHDPAQVERAVIGAMAQQKVPPMQAFDAVMKESCVNPGNAQHAAEVVAQEYTRAELIKEGKPEVDLDAEARKRFPDVYKRAESGIDAELKAMNEQSQKEAQAEQQRLDAEAEQKRLDLEKRREAERMESDREMSLSLTPR